MKLVVNNETYHLTSDGAGEPLVLLHGFTGSTDSWAPLIRAFASFRRVICVDLLGHGETAHPLDARRYTMESQLSDLATLLAQLHISRADVLGYSMGGRVALSFACAYPERVHRLILESASPGLANPEERGKRQQRDEQLAARIVRDGITAFTDYWASIPLFASQAALPEAAKNALRAERLHNSPIGLAGSLRGMGTGAQPSLWSRLGRLAVPTLLITGGDDQKFCDIARKMDEQLPFSRPAVVAGCGHNVHLEDSARFARLVRTFLREEEKVAVQYAD